MAWCLVVGCLALAVSTARAVELPKVEFLGTAYVVHTIDLRKADLRLFIKDEQGQSLRDFVGLNKYLQSRGQKVVFAANAGMFEPDLRPVGLLVLDGQEKSPLNLREAPGNFYWKPNGVFLIDQKRRAKIVESEAYPSLKVPAMWASQSGPLLVQGGAIHPRFNPESKSLKIRSGIGVRKDGTVVFAMSWLPVTFYDFASLFLLKLDCPNALFLDGDISAFYIPGINEAGLHSFGPMFGVVEKVGK